MLSFAIVIPHLNQSRFLGSALESLRHQGVPLQTALVDGGSSDGLSAIVDSYRGQIDYFRSAPDKGQSDAINEGAAHIRGDIFAWLNADDYYYPGVLDRVADFFEAHPRVDVLYGDATHVTAEGFFLSYFPAVMPFDPRALPSSCFICQPACFMRKSAFDRAGGLDPGLHYTMDWDLWCRLMRSGARFHYLPEVMAAVRYYPETKTLSGGRRRYREIGRIGRKYGHRLLPLSWLGFYRYDLALKPDPTPLERVLMRNLDRMRFLKGRIRRARGVSRALDEPLYGFQRWEPVVEDKGVIKLAWYDKSRWKDIRLSVSPPSGDYRVSVNGRDCPRLPDEGARLAFAAPVLEDPYREIAVERRDRPGWRLSAFACTLQ